MTRARRCRPLRTLVLVLAAAAACAPAACSRNGGEAGRSWGETRAADLEVLPIGGDFTLTDADGRPFALADHRGQAIVLLFGYTSCPDFCPAAMSKIGAALARLGTGRDRVLTAFISVDPERDTPAALKAYTSNFRIRAVGLTGSADALQTVADRYAAFYEKSPSSSALGYLVSHTTYLYVIDPQGRVRKLVRHDDGPEVLAEALTRVLSDGAGRTSALRP